ncbi:hypothetical protein VNI00_008738 [Paramarasmius palmivorus]|uniref:F-box domain-containing protein n=1 Tax=Paramarasmius palmivorus TaxID=297713 RepID=A0AAW0CVE9_9AGAR
MDSSQTSHSFHKPPFTTSSAKLNPLFRTPVSSSDRSLISQFLLDAQAESREHQVEISKLKTVIIARETKQQGLNKMIDHYRSLLSPIHRLPQELLTLIFESICDMNELHPSRAPSAMVLSSVCGRWRELAMSTPSLWSSIRISCSTWDDNTCESLVYLTRIFLERSRSYPLKLDLDFILFHFEYEEWTHAGSAFGLLVQHSHRWLSLKLLVQRYDFDHTLFRSLRDQLPMLRYLSVDDEVGDDLDSESGTLFEHCPNLTSVQLRADRGFSAGIVLPWSQLVTLDVPEGLIEPLLQVLKECSGLERLSLGEITRDYRDADDNSEEDEGPIFHSSTIRHLTIHATNIRQISRILKRITMPQLASIEIRRDARYNWGLVGWNEEIFADFMSRSACSITSMRLEVLPITDRQLISLLTLVPSLRTLAIQEVIKDRDDKPATISEDFLHHLTVEYQIPSSARHFLPQLSDLALTVSGKHLHEQALLQALSSRWTPDTSSQVDRLRAFSLTVVGSQGDSSPGCFASLQNFRDAGLRVATRHVLKSQHGYFSL